MKNTPSFSYYFIFQSSNLIFISLLSLESLFRICKYLRSVKNRHKVLFVVTCHICLKSVSTLWLNPYSVFLSDNNIDHDGESVGDKIQVFIWCHNKVWWTMIQYNQWNVVKHTYMYISLMERYLVHYLKPTFLKEVPYLDINIL